MTGQFPGSGDGGGQREVAPGRRASVRLRAPGTGGPERDLLDPANQSLADALRITFRLLQVTMVVLAGLYALSGFQSVKEGETGIRLLFGRVVDKDLSPGFRASFPPPLGELVRVPASSGRIALDEEFWPYLRPEDRGKAIADLPRGATSLNPAQDGSVLTADLNLAHTQWEFTYRRTDPSRVAEHIHPEHEERIARAAVKRGVVRAIAGVTIDDLLKQAASDPASITQRTRDAAQAMLDRMDSGLTIDTISLKSRMPPLRLYDRFAEVQGKQSDAAGQLEKADAARRERLNSTAGEAAPTLLALIDRYEAAIAQGDEARQRETLALIDGILDGREVELDGQARVVPVAGEVSRRLNDAALTRSRLVEQRRSELTLFRAKLEQYRANPALVTTSLWQEALGAFMSRENVQMLWLPPGSGMLEVVINADPDIVKDIERAQQQAEADRARADRERAQREARFRTDTTRPVRGD